MRNKLLLAMLLCAPFVSAQSGKTDRVAGIVVNASTGAPLARVQIHLRREPDGQSWGAMTAPDGHFSITGMPPDSYTLQIERAGFSVPFDLPEELEIGAADNANLHFALTPDGAITGRVLDADGHAVEDVELRAEPDFASADSPRALTDANGNFRLGGLSPGPYHLLAVPQNTWSPPEQRTDGTTDMQDAPTWSHAIQVSSGNEAGGIEIHLTRLPIAGVSGRIENPPPNAANTELLLESRDNGERTTGGVKPDGSFHLWRLYPGDYELRAVWQTPDGATIQSAPAGFHIADKNVDGIRLHPAAPMTVTGHIVFDDDAARPQHGVVTKIVLLNAGLRTNAVTADVRPDGSFEIPNVPPGRYRPVLTWSGAYADSSLLDLTNGPPAAPSGDLTIHASSAVGSLTGTTEPGLAVILILDGPGSLPRVTDAAPNGSYSFRSVTPGKYRIVAVPQAERDAFLDRAADYRDLTDPISIAPRQNVARNLQPRKLTGRP
ncbi:MAG TPA: carboxypeptidase regulatory-like domain-containing protein [Bryobacteraceae bacterium]|nr:carboxypeptidase regulatory-like domain-containing protein [Bryobacteraceae bacterium]